MFKHKLVSVAEMIVVEKEANKRGLTYDQMMENAGKGLALSIQEHFGFLENAGCLGLVGSGNNGGDTLVALTHLLKDGWKASAYLVKPRPQNDPLLSEFSEAGGDIFSANEDQKFEIIDQLLNKHAILVDGVLGTGTKLPLRGKIKSLLEHIGEILANQSELTLVVAVDCPSGIDCDSGETAPETIAADLTVTMAAIKRGLLKFPAFDYVGDLELVEIGLEDHLPVWMDIQRFVLSQDDVKSILPERPRNAHKGTFGTAMIVGGSLNYTGAVFLAGKAAYLSGVGLVTMGIPAPLHASLAGVFPEATWILLPHELGVVSKEAVPVIQKRLDPVTAMLIGPGFGLEPTSREFIEGVLTGNRSSSERRSIGFVLSGEKNERDDSSSRLPPLVIDADGLKLLSQILDWHTKIPAPAILTPHPGEMAVITGLNKTEIQENRIETAERFAQEWGHVIVLKGANTIVASPKGKTVVIPVATPALARAGTGDVLAGIIVGLRAQGVDAFEAAAAGVWIHAMAGLMAEDQVGSSASVLAGDVLEATAFVIEQLS